MKKKILYSLAILVGVIVIFNLPSCSCGSEKSDKLDTLIVKPETEKIKGPLGDCFKVLDRKYKGKYMDMISKYEVNIEIERTEGENEMVNEHIDNLTEFKSSNGKCYVGFTIELLDADKCVIGTVEAFNAGVPSIIKNTRSGETGTVEFDIPSNIASQIHSFRLASTCELNPEKEEEKEEVKDVKDDDVVIDDKDLENAEKALEVGVKALEATNEALKVLNDLQ